MTSRLLELPGKRSFPMSTLLFLTFCSSLFCVFCCSQYLKLSIVFSFAIRKCGKGQERIFKVAGCHHIPATKRWSLLSL